MTVSSQAIGRKERFHAALKLARLSLGAWALQQGVSRSHLNFVLTGHRQPGADLERAIESFIEEQFAKAGA